MEGGSGFDFDFDVDFDRRGGETGRAVGRKSEREGGRDGAEELTLYFFSLRALVISSLVGAPPMGEGRVVTCSKEKKREMKEGGSD